MMLYNGKSVNFIPTNMYNCSFYSSTSLHTTFRVVSTEHILKHGHNWRVSREPVVSRLEGSAPKTTRDRKSTTDTEISSPCIMHKKSRGRGGNQTQDLLETKLSPSQASENDVCNDLKYKFKLKMSFLNFLGIAHYGHPRGLLLAES